MSHETLQVIWFALWGVLWAVYFVLDGFDLGVGVLYPFMGGTEQERAVMRRSISPFWDGNEVWLITAGGATFAAFPAAYAGMFSFLYSALMLLLFSLIARGVSIEFRSKGEGRLWAGLCDMGFFVGSFMPAFLFGVAFGNIFRGLPLDAEGYHGSFFQLLNPYGLLTGSLFTMIFTMHGAIWLSLKAPAAMSGRFARKAGLLWAGAFICQVAFLFFSWTSTGLGKNYMDNPVRFILPALALASLIATRVFIGSSSRWAFYSSSQAIALTLFTGFIGLFPYIVPSRIDPGYGLTAYNSSSSYYTLGIMTAVASVFVPIVVLYQIWVYRTFRHRLTEQDAEEKY